MAQRVCVGQIVGVHGVRGALRIRAFTARPEDVGAYGPLEDETGSRRLEIRVMSVKGEMLVATATGIDDRDAAEALKGLRLYVARDRLPPPDVDEFYHADLVGLSVELENGRVIGRVLALYDFGAGDVIEIELATGGQPLVLPFTRDAVPVVDLDRGIIVVSPPAGLELGEREG